MAEDPAAARPRVGFILERTLGHATHAANLQSLIAPNPAIDAVFSCIGYPSGTLAERIPLVRNWTLQAGRQARRSVRRMRQQGPLDALFVNSQVPAMLMPDVLRRIPTVVSLDATPRQFDDLGEHYDHGTGPRAVERVKANIHSLCFRRAVKLVTWSEWAKAGLVDDYGIADDKIVVIPPGIDLTRWDATRSAAQVPNGPLRLLFVGGDFARKGGLVLLEAARRLGARGVNIDMDIVTRDHVPVQHAVRVHHRLAANSVELIELYRRADMFCLPTRAETFGIAFVEAGALGLPAIATNVGGVSEIVRHERSGLLVRVDDAASLADAIERLVVDPALRRRLGEQARRLVRERYNGSTNADRLVDLMREVATSG